MLRLLFCCLGLLAGSSLRGADTSALTRWLSSQTNMQTWTADVTQTRSLKTLVQPLVARGHVWFAAPNQFRWEIGSPAETIAVRQPEEMLVIYPRLKRAEKYPLGAQAAGPWKDTLALLEAGFPRSSEELESKFKVVSEKETDHTHEVSLQPKAASARRMMPLIKISFSLDDFSLRATELQFADGSSMKNEFTNQKLNPSLGADVFKPVIANDFKIVEPLKR
ncbi:MAG: LolA family protein [Verrucomicrobiales bacterium]|nr:LolA family protein [Verrucomicrobiales bacterium]